MQRRRVALVVAGAGLATLIMGAKGCTADKYEPTDGSYAARYEEMTKTYHCHPVREDTDKYYLRHQRKSEEASSLAHVKISKAAIPAAYEIVGFCER